MAGPNRANWAIPNGLIPTGIPNSFEVGDFFTSGASKMLGNTMKRKIQFKAVTREEAKDFVDALKKSK